MRLFLGLILFTAAIGAANAQSASLAPMPGLAASATPASGGDAALAPLDLAALPMPGPRGDAKVPAAAPLAPLPSALRQAPALPSIAAARPVPAVPATPAASTRPTASPSRPWSAPQYTSTALAPLPEPEASALARVTTTFAIRQGETLQAALTRWCGAAGWTLVWKSTRDYRIEAPITFPHGTAFDEAVQDTMRSIWRMSPTVKSTLYLRNNVLLLTEVNG